MVVNNIRRFVDGSNLADLKFNFLANRLIIKLSFNSYDSEIITRKKSFLL